MEFKKSYIEKQKEAMKRELDLAKSETRHLDRSWYWLYTVVNGKPYRRGPFPSENMADEALQLMGTEAEATGQIFKLPTRNPAAAGSMMKDKLINQTNDISNAMQRQRLRDPETYRGR